MKVLRVTGGLAVDMGGPTESVVNSIIAMRREGLCSLVLFPGTAAEGERLAGEGVPYERFAPSGLGRRRARRWGISVKLVRALSRAAREHDLVHAHGAWTITTMAALLIAKGAKRPF